VVAIELQGQVLARERELDSREGIIAAWEDGLVAFEHALGKVHIKRNVSHVRAEAVQQDFSAQSCASSSRSKRLTDLNWTLEEHQILFCLQEADLEMQEAILVEEKAHSLHPPDGWDLLAELEETHVRVDEINDERAIKARQLS
jgi:hypothetical protein